MTVCVSSEIVCVIVAAPLLIPSAIALIVSTLAFAADAVAPDIPESIPDVIPFVIAAPDAVADAVTPGRFPSIVLLNVLVAVWLNAEICSCNPAEPVATPVDIPFVRLVPAASPPASSAPCCDCNPVRRLFIVSVPVPCAVVFSVPCILTRELFRDVIASVPDCPAAVCTRYDDASIPPASDAFMFVPYCVNSDVSI